MSTGTIWRFLALAFLLGWLFQGLAIAGGVNGGGRPWLIAAMWAPMLAALLAGPEARRLLRNGLRRAGLRSWLLALVAGCSFSICQQLLLWMTGAGSWNAKFFELSAGHHKIEEIHHLGMLLGVGPQRFSLFALNLVLSVSLASVLGMLTGGVGEEAGWRGILQRDLARRFGFYKGTVIVGLIWGYWHLPANLAGYNDTHHPVLQSLLIFEVFTLAMSFVLVWLLERSNSIWPAALAHAANNTVVSGLLIVPGSWMADQLSGICAAILLGSVAAVVLNRGNLTGNYDERTGMGFAFSVGGHGVRDSRLRKRLLKHFGVAASEVATAARQFPITARMDIQTALEELLRSRPRATLFGIVSPNPHEPPSFAHTLSGGHFPIDIGPIQHDEIDIGEAMPVRCLKNGLWLSREQDLPFAIIMAPGGRFGLRTGVQLEIAVPSGERGAIFSQGLFRDLELLVSKGTTYRGRVISLEAHIDVMGGGSMVKVHRLGKVRREDVILPQKTLAILDRNVAGFMAVRDQLRKLQFQTRKGLLFYGPPGTGKTHTIHYLATQLPGHTTLLVTAEQVLLLGEYFRLARFLQPSIMVIEDVDLIGRERTARQGGGEEMLLNKLLNEMDGLREDADVLFILTTNRPDQIEPALASRPGRIDQAIEFPLPDEEGRAKLVKLYARGLEISDELMHLMVSRTKGVSAAFMKELMRRCAQFQIEFSSANTLTQSALDGALEEMLFTGGTLNRRLLGGERATGTPN